MNYYLLSFIAMLLIVSAIIQTRKRIISTAINHRRNDKKEGILKMKELAQKFVGKDCLVYTVVSDVNCVKGTIIEVTDSGLLIESEGKFQAVNLEYVTRICEWPKKKNGKKKSVLF